MRTRLFELLAVVAVAATACSALAARAPEHAADADAARGGAEAEGLAPVPAQPAVAEVVNPSSLTLDENLNLAVTAEGSGSSTPSTPTTSASTTTTVSPPSSSERVPRSRTTPQPEASGKGESADEPVFDAEPVRPLDLASLPPDDAGIGASETGPVPRAAVGGWAAFDAALSDSLLRYGNTAASVAVSIGGDVVHSSAFGTRVPGTVTEVSPDDRFRIASISKTITAVTLLQLVQDGVVGLDEPIGARLAQHLGVPNASGGSQHLTVGSLLTHTTGYGKYYGTFFGNGAADCRHAGSIGLIQGGGGGGYRYSNMNYCLAGIAIEALTGRGYEDAVYENLLTPLGLSGLRLAPTFDPGPGETQHVTTAGRNYMETLGAAGSWIASPTDLVTILDALDPSTPGWKPLTDDTLRQMLTPVYGEFGQRGYGMGMILYGGGRYGHTGTIENTHAMVQNRGDGVIWSVTVAGPYPDDTPNLEGIINGAFEAGGFISP